ncbi:MULTISPECIES: M50 family metallopeptidase [Nocardiopsis]|uniref:M50 family metallopeptidase n=1 Tax=Nocardiopsis changdeensis TaxID=2831969 RepID=A0ABX8BMG1_9ACTN|nr:MULTISPECIES: M50 family metallopeptidase [Nocardiopsis]QUX22071.1 M50 family metallopeptidase [Nocardiopsis changdeensis]QYX38009.1 M50 family metallopeptidase [Nocardiopsis sp. MT53]
METTFGDVWQEVLTTQPEPEQWIVIGAAVLALAAVLFNPVWRVARNVVTIAHEGGHALVALLSGRQLTAIRLHSDTSGVTVSRGKPTGVGMVLTVFAGYVASSVIGLLGIVVLMTDHITALLWLSLVVLAAMLLMIRNLYGVLSVVGTGAVVFGISWFTPSEVQAAFAYLFIWFLLFAGIRPVFELQRQRVRQPSPHSDADQLARLTGLPGTLWVVVFGLVNLAVTGLGVWMLLLA